MQPLALLQRTERLLEQINHMLHRTPSLPMLTGLTRRLSALHRCVEGYDLRLPLGRLTALRGESELHPDAAATHAAHHLTSTAPNSTESRSIFHLQKSSIVDGTEGDKQHALQGALHTHDGMSPAVGGLLFTAQPHSLETHHQREGKAGSASQMRVLSAHPEPSSATPTPVPKPQAQEAAESGSDNVPRAPLQVSSGYAQGLRRPLLRRSVLPVSSITHVQVASRAASLQATGMTQGETPRNSMTPRHVQVQPIGTPVAGLAPRSLTPPELTAQADLMQAAAVSLKRHTSATPPATGVLAHQPVSDQQSGLLPRRWPAGVTEPGHAHQQQRVADEGPSSWPGSPQQPGPALDRAALGQPTGDSGSGLVIPQWWLEEAERERDSNPAPEARATLLASEEDVQRLAEQLERLLRDEARRHGIEL